MHLPHPTPVRAARPKTWRWVVASLVALTLLAWWGEVFRGTPLFFFVDVIGAKRPGEGAVTVLSGFALAVAGALHIVAGRIARQRRGSHGPWWFAAGAGLLVLGLDEMLMAHEWLAQHLDALQVPRVFGADRDLYVFACYGLVALLVAARLLPVWRRLPVVWTPLVLTAVLAVLSQILDSVAWSSLGDVERRVLGSAEEILKSTATFCAVLYSLVLVDALVAEPAVAPGLAVEDSDRPTRAVG